MTRATLKLEQTDSIDIDSIDLDLPTEQELWEADSIAQAELIEWLEGLKND